MSNGKNHILVVDDDPLVREFLRHFLEISGHQVTEAEDTETAAVALAENPVDIVLTDVVLPDASGIELFDRLRAQAPELAVILMTGAPKLQDAVGCVRRGAVDYLTKPIDPAALTRAIDKAVEQHPPPRPPTELDFANLQQVGRYTVGSVLGEGGAGIVYQARDAEAPDHPVALKVLKPQPNSAENQQRVHRFFREIHVLQRLDHPNVVRVLDCGYARREGLFYLAMEFISGHPLRLYTTGLVPLDRDGKLRLILQAVAALSASHARDICHRDIKPDNLLVRDDLTLKITDFGIARIPQSELTITGRMLGSPAYNPPESFRSARVDARADIFSLGVVAYELLTGHNPFRHDGLAATMDAILNRKPPPPAALIADFPAPLADVLAGMLTKDRDRRYQSMEEVKHDLAAAIRNHPPVRTPDTDAWG